MRHRLVLGLLSLPLLLTGCPRPPLPLDFGPRGRLEDPDVALEAVRARATKVHSVRGEAKAKVDSADGGGSLTQFIIAEAPDRMRLESIDFFGRPVAVLASDGERGSLYDLERNIVYQGPATARMVARLLPLSVEPEVLVALLLGSPPVPAEAVATSLEVDEAARAYVLTLSDGRRITLELATLRPLSVRTTDWKATFDDWSEHEQLPGKVMLEAPGGKARIELDWRDREVNPPLDPEVFQVEVPEGATVRAL